MKIVIISQRAPLYLPYFLDRVCGRIKEEGIELSALVLMSPYTKNNLWLELKQRIGFYGFSSFIKLSCLILKNKLRSKIFNGSGECFSIENVLQKHNVTELKTDKVNDSNFHQKLKELDTDVIVSIACPQIFKEGILSVPKLKAINYHTAKLPKYRGRQPLFWALYHDEPASGVTVHEMDVKIDNGAIVSQRDYSIDPNDTIDTLYYKSMKVGEDCLVEALTKLKNGDTSRIENDASQSSYYSFPKAEDAKRFREKGKRFI